MRNKALIVIGLLVAFLVIPGCSPNPEKGLLARYFNAVTLNDNDTMSSIALEPFQPDMTAWRLVSISAEKIEPAKLPDLNKAEIEVKKAHDAQIGPTIDADTLLKDAQYEKDTSRSAAGKAAAQRKIDELQAKYDAENAKMQALKKDYNVAKAAAAAEEEMTMFSLDPRLQLPTVRELTGNVHSKDVEVTITTKASGMKNYNLTSKQTLPKTENNTSPPRGRWVILKFEPLS